MKGVPSQRFSIQTVLCCFDLYCLFEKILNIPRAVAFVCSYLLPFQKVKVSFPEVRIIMYRVNQVQWRFRYRLSMGL